MTEVQAAAIAKAEAQIEPAMRLYERRNRISFLAGHLSLDELEVLAGLEIHEFRLLVRYAQGLAAGRFGEQGLEEDASSPPPDSAKRAPG